MNNNNMKLAWLTDIHINFLDSHARIKYYQEIIDTQCDAVLISGDIAEAPDLADLLTEMANKINKPIYFVLGNHDYYRGKINAVHQTITILTQTHEQIFWLPASGIQQLTNHTILLGQDGWADGRFGNYSNSNISLNDSRMIVDLFQENRRGKDQLLKKMQALADNDAAQLQNDLMLSIRQQPSKIIILTHVPPFKESCVYEGQISDENWLPYFSSKVMGDMILPIAKDNPTIQFLVLCGHTHSAAYYQPLANLSIKTGQAKYYEPQVQEIIAI